MGKDEEGFWREKSRGSRQKGSNGPGLSAQDQELSVGNKGNTPIPNAVLDALKFGPIHSSTSIRSTQ